MTEAKAKIIIILGPTASGKTSLSIKLAKKFQGEIVSADSRQIYQGLDLGTGKITKKEMQSIPHYLLDICQPKQRFSMAQFQKMATSKLKDIAQRGKTPFSVGGSAFYIYSVADGWVMPKVKANPSLRKELAQKSPAELFAILEKLDLRRAQTIEKQNPRRLIRAIEIAKQLGFVPERINKPVFDCLFLGIKQTDKTLKTLIKNRLQARLESGMVKEVSRLLKSKKLTYKRCQELGLEYKWLAKFINKEIDQPTMFDRLNSDIWRFSRHQMNWFKKDKRIKWVKNESQAEKLVKKFIK